MSTGWNKTAAIVAGVGTSGTGATRFNLPAAIAMDSSKSLYVADRINNRTQKWLYGASNGSTVAGSPTGIPGSNLSYLIFPLDVELDSSGNLYIADSDNNRVVLWTVGASSGTIVAGAGKMTIYKRVFI